jgi:hypothetical protein
VAFDPAIEIAADRQLRGLDIVAALELGEELYPFPFGVATGAPQRPRYVLEAAVLRPT